MSNHSEPTTRWRPPRLPANHETWLAEDSRDLRVLERWRSEYRIGSCRRIETYFERNPELAKEPALAMRLIYEEACLREEAGEVAELSEYVQRFPQWSDELAMLWDCHTLLNGSPPAHVFPEVGDAVGDFRLLAELDRGAAGRVYLATQPNLSDRPVVLKVTALDGNEHLSLARLQHAGIVPLYLVQDNRERHLRILCMPYLGGTSLARLLPLMAGTPPAERRGQDICRALDQCRSPLVESIADRGPARKLYARSSYVDAICWIGASLADALHHAHLRDLVHLDVKPSNVLIAGDGQPMLLDFHLAQPMLPAFQTVAGPLGGTNGYMSPEQAAALDAVRAGHALRQPVDARSDIYSLGVVLRECLTGKSFEDGPSPHPLHHWNPAITPGIADIIGRCLERDPAKRYGSAAELAEDLRRHVLHLPLQGVANRSLRERWTKWRRRRPYAVWTGVAVAALTLTLTLVTVAVSGRMEAARNALLQSRELLDEGKYANAADTARLAVDLIRYVPAGGELRQELRGQLRTAGSLRLLDHLHQVVEQVRILDGIIAPSEKQLRETADGYASVWRMREALVHAASILDDPQDQQVRERFQRDFADLAVLWSDAESRLQGAESATNPDSALQVLDETEERIGPARAVAYERQRLLAQSSATTLKLTPASTADSAWDHFVYGRACLRQNDIERALEALETAASREPQSFWFHYALAICYFRLEQFDKALTEMSICVALEPQHLECYRARARIYEALGRPAEAQRDVDLVKGRGK